MKTKQKKGNKEQNGITTNNKKERTKQISTLKTTKRTRWRKNQNPFKILIKIQNPNNNTKKERKRKEKTDKHK